MQDQPSEVGLPYGLIRTVTCALVSSPGRPCIDAIPLPAETNEVGHFQPAFQSLASTYGGLFDLVSYDAGGLSRAGRLTSSKAAPRAPWQAHRRSTPA